MSLVTVSGALFKDVISIGCIFSLIIFQYINAVNQTVYLVDPSKSSTEEADSIRAAQKFRYLFWDSLLHS